jgi:hypothetical protein
MNPDKRECLPIGRVLDTVLKVERDVTRFYVAAASTVPDDEARRLFTTLGADMRLGTDAFGEVCKSLRCGSEGLENATEGDVYFLSVLAESAFYSKAGRPEELAAPDLHTASLVENGLDLERNLLLFYMSFYNVSCAAHRPVFSGLIERGQRHIMELTNVRNRLKQR